MDSRESLLFLPHRLPYPPNKGDKVRSFHILGYLAQRYRVFVATFVDDPLDEQYIPKLQEYCAGLEVVRLKPKLGKVLSLRGLVTGEALTLPYFRDAGLARWVESTVREQNIGTAVVYCSSMAQYVPPRLGLRVLTDFVDVDSAKWGQYAEGRPWPLSWLYRREARELLAFERKVAERSEASFFVTEAEVALFRNLIPGSSAVVEALGNGVDSVFFSPELPSASPFGRDEIPVVFTGAMDYWPNEDAVTWFAQDMLPALRKQRPMLKFYIVGMRPSAAVRQLAGEHVVVTGTVPDVRPYLRHASIVVAPLRVARGLQNKVLEAMAMSKPVVVADTCAGALDVEPGIHIEVAGSAQDFVDRIEGLLQDRERAERMGTQARARVLERYSWQAHLQVLGRYLG